MYMSKGQIWVGSIPPMAQSSLNLLYLRLSILGLHVPRLAELPCKEIVEGSIPFGSTKNTIFMVGIVFNGQVTQMV